MPPLPEPSGIIAFEPFVIADLGPVVCPARGVDVRHFELDIIKGSGRYRPFDIGFIGSRRSHGIVDTVLGRKDDREIGIELTGLQHFT